VAIVEDDASMRRSLERLLTAHGFHTESFASAEALLDSETFPTIGCAVIDIDLGGMDGIQLRCLLSVSHRDIEVIFITAMDDPLIEAKAIEAGCIAYLRKPFDTWLLIDSIKSVLAE
jgi:FixJ family two-component response regulator